MEKNDIDWSTILPEPFAICLLGGRGEGKTALAHRLVEEFGDNGRDAYIMGFPSSKDHLLPDWIETLPAGTAQEQWPTDSIVLIHEAHHVIHARRSMDVENLELDFLVTVSRHKDSDIIYDTQQSHRLDKNAVAAVDALLVRWPALLQEEFERRAVRGIIEDARGALEEHVTVHDEDDFTYVERPEDENGVEELKKHVYVHADQFVGKYPHEVQLPDHWSEEISKAYGDHEEAAEPGGPDYKDLDEVRDDMADVDDVTEKSVEEVEALIEETGIEETDTGGVEGTADEAEAKARDLVRQLRERDQRVISNDFQLPIVEIIVLEEDEEAVYNLVQEARELPGDDKRSVPVPPSIDDSYPEAASAMTGFQFKLDEMNADDLSSSGYDLASIFDTLEDEVAMASKSPVVEATLPWE